MTVPLMVWRGTPVLTIDVSGREHLPKPKGSLRHVGGGRLIEQLAGSTEWRATVAAAARAAGAHLTRPLSGPLAVRAHVTVPKPKSAPKSVRTWPIGRKSGDIDKHARNILDALTDAAIWNDDSQVIDLHVTKHYPTEDDLALQFPGAVIHIWTVGEDQ